MLPDHPVALLRARLVTEFVDDLPAGVHPIPRWCRDPQFFPGATGLLAAPSWAEVAPGTAMNQELLPAPRRGVLVLGNYQATLSSYHRLDGSIGGFATTWRVLRQLLASVPPPQVFLTNAYIGLPDLGKDTASFPTTPSFTGRCARLLTTEIELFEPRVVVCLGVPAAGMLAQITDALSMWQPWPGYRTLRRLERQSITGCRVGGVTFIAVAVRHPSAVLSKVDREHDVALVTEAAASGR
jgi:hypothetical protein